MARPRLERFGMARKKLRRRKKEASEKEEGSFGEGISKKRATKRYRWPPSSYRVTLAVLFYGSFTVQ